MISHSTEPNPERVKLAYEVFTEAWRYYRRCLEYGLDTRSPGAWAKAADDMSATWNKFRGTPAETLAGDILGAVYTTFDRRR